MRRRTIDRSRSTARTWTSGISPRCRFTLLAGRGIEPADRDESRRVAVITSAMAQRYWPGQPEAALGREFRLREGGEPYRVIGVVADYKVDTPGEKPKAYIHLPFGRQETFGNYRRAHVRRGDRYGAGCSSESFARSIRSSCSSTGERCATWQTLGCLRCARARG